MSLTISERFKGGFQRGFNWGLSTVITSFFAISLGGMYKTIGDGVERPTLPGIGEISGLDIVVGLTLLAITIGATVGAVKGPYKKQN